jgi:cytochrome c553
MKLVVLGVLAVAVGVGQPGGLVRTKLPAGLVVEKAGVLVLFGGGLDEPSCRALRAVTAKVTAFGLSGRVVGGGDCGGSWKAAEAEAGFVGRAIGPGGAGRFAVLVSDGKGIVRYQRVLAATAEGIGVMGSELIAWEQGRASFSGHCGHCHGDDGTGTFFQGVKSMEGSTLRLSEEKILEGGETFGAVPISTWSKGEVESLLLFVRGL